MTWSGEIYTSAKVGAPVVLSRRGRTFAVPKRVTLTMDGAKGSPDLRVECAMTDGVPAVREVHIVAKPYGEPVRDAHAHSLALEKIAIQAFMSHASTVRASEQGDLSGVMAGSPNADPLLEGALNDAQKRRRPPSHAELERVAEVYKAATDSPRSAVIVRLGYTDRTADRRIKQAEEAGLLTRPQRGKARA